MCGIAVDARRLGDRADEHALRRMLDVMEHRGPDRRATALPGDGTIGVGHARLSIIDLTSAADQPMPNEDSSLWLVCNGEVYNHAALRAELSRRGHVFRSASDNEVILHGYEEWGEDVLVRLRGMFAFAITDPARRRVFVARDRIGEKPLAYLEDHRGVLLASEIPALSSTGRVSNDVEPSALALLFSRNLRHVPDPLSIHRDVRKLPAAHAMVVEDGRVGRLWRWWSPTWTGPEARGEEVRAEIDRAVELQQEADVEVGALLSGGVDSSIVVGLAAPRARGIRTYALGRDGNDPELKRAREASRRFGTRHTERHFEIAQMQRLDVMVAQLGEPIALLPITHADALMGAVAEDGLRVVLTGNGADELFFGYDGAAATRRLSILIEAAAALPSSVRARILRGVPAGSRAATALRLAGLPLRRRKVALYEQDIAGVATLLRPELREEAASTATLGPLNLWSAAFDGRTYPDLSHFLALMCEDSHSVTIIGDLVGMHHSVEVRAPFLDHVVAETAFRLPMREKIGSLGRPVGKRVLKEQFAELIGHDIAAAPKMGFGYGLQESELLRGPLKAHVWGRLEGSEAVEHYFDRGTVERILDEHARGTGDHGKTILTLYAFDAWARSAPQSAVTA